MGLRRRHAVPGGARRGRIRDTPASHHRTSRRRVPATTALARHPWHRVLRRRDRVARAGCPHRRAHRCNSGPERRIVSREGAHAVRHSVCPGSRCLDCGMCLAGVECAYERGCASRRCVVLVRGHSSCHLRRRCDGDTGPSPEPMVGSRGGLATWPHHAPGREHRSRASHVAVRVRTGRRILGYGWVRASVGFICCVRRLLACLSNRCRHRELGNVASGS